MVEANVARQANDKRRAALAAEATSAETDREACKSAAAPSVPATLVGFDSLSLLRYAFHDDENVYLVSETPFCRESARAFNSNAELLRPPVW